MIGSYIDIKHQNILLLPLNINAATKSRVVYLTKTKHFSRAKFSFQ